MKQTLFLFALITIFGSMFPAPKKCNPKILTKFYKKGKFITTDIDNAHGYSINHLNGDNKSLHNCDSISIEIIK